jgi:NAD-dependent deacetylase
MWEKVDPMEVAHIDAFRRDPDRFWHFYSQRFMSLRDKQPNRAHEIVAELERRGLVRAVVTQNIDRLHRAAGSRDVIELHGSIAESICLGCGGRYELEKVVEMIEQDPTTAPECSACIAPLKPDVVLFGEFLPEDALLLAVGVFPGDLEASFG